MTQYNNNNSKNESRYTRKAVENLKAALKASEFGEIELTVYGIQIYAAYLDYNEYHEYYVVMKAERDIMTGRYYFITREGLRIAWSRLNPDTLITAAIDFADRIEEEEKKTAEAVENLEKYETVAIDSRFFFAWVRPVLELMGIGYHFHGCRVSNDGRAIDIVSIDRPATRKPSEPVRHWLHSRPSEELAEIKADRIRKAEALHEAGHYPAAAYVSELCGMISEEQTARRADEIEKARTAAKADRIRKAAELLPVAYMMTNDTNTRAVLMDGERRVNLSTEELDEARHLLETARELAQIVTTEQTPAKADETRATYKVLALVAIYLTDPTTKTESTTRRGRAYIEITWPFGGCLLSAEDFAKARRVADLLATPDEPTEPTESPAERETVAEPTNSTPTTSEADTERENVGRIERRAATGHELTSAECEAVKEYHEKNGGRVPAAVTACVLFLVSLTIGNSAPAKLYTATPAEVVEEIKANTSEKVRASWHEVPAPDSLPPYDVPALLDA